MGEMIFGVVMVRQVKGIACVVKVGACRSDNLIKTICCMAIGHTIDHSVFYSVSWHRLFSVCSLEKVCALAIPPEAFSTVQAENAISDLLTKSIT